MTVTTTRRETLTFNLKGTSYRLRRLGDGEYAELFQSCIAIERIPFLAYGEILDVAGLSLGEFYAGMKSLFGERSRMFDDYKCTFSFPLALDVPGVPRSPAYLLDINDFRGWVEHGFRKVVEPSDPRLRTYTYYPPDPQELSAERMMHIVSYLMGFQQGCYETRPHVQEPFLMAVTSNCILYGFDGMEFFAERHDHEADFDARLERLAAHLPAPGFYS